MELIRITDQKQSLEAHYSDLETCGEDKALSRICHGMRELLVLIREISGPPIWAVTSHYELNLVSGDDYRLPILVSINCGNEWFSVAYLMPSDEAPWPGSNVISHTKDVTVACQMVAFGLSKATGISYISSKSVRTQHGY